MLKVLVAASGFGSNFEALINSSFNGKDYSIVGLFSNKKKARALEVAAANEIPSKWVSHKKLERADHEKELLSFFRERDADILVLAGYMRVLSPFIIGNLQNKIINIHPSLLPAFKGTTKAIDEAFDFGCKVTGVTVHIVDVEVDEGKILAQQAVEISSQDSKESLAEKIHVVEHKIYPQVLKIISEKKTEN